MWIFTFHGDDLFEIKTMYYIFVLCFTWLRYLYLLAEENQYEWTYVNMFIGYAVYVVRFIKSRIIEFCVVFTDAENNGLYTWRFRIDIPIPFKRKYAKKQQTNKQNETKTKTWTIYIYSLFIREWCFLYEHIVIEWN